MNREYKKIREIGKGGMAVVYLARHVPLNRMVAVKVLRNESPFDRAYIRRFFREARITDQLDHPNIINVIESNYSGEDYYIVTEYIDGGDLSAVLKNPGVTLHKKLEILLKVTAALDHAHQQGIVHRDVKPSNILLTRDLEPKLCDFGIATALWGRESRLTQTNETIGTMDYIAPEQKENSKSVDFRADIYSLGVILYQAVTGSKPQGAFPPPVEVVPSIPRRLNECIMKCLQPWPYRRYKSTRNLYEELDAVLKQFKPPRIVPPAEVPAGAASSPGTAENTTDTATVRKAPAAGPPVAAPAEAPEKEAPPEFDTIIETLQSGSLTQKLDSKGRLLESIDKSHEEELIRLLEHAEGLLKETVIEALGKIKSEKSCAYLIELLNDPYYNKTAAVAVGEIGCKEAEYKLFNLLISGSANAHIALMPLAKLNSVKSIKEMARFLQSPHEWIRETALDALALVTGSKEPAAYFKSVSRKDGNARIRARAKKLLRRIEEQ